MRQDLLVRPATGLFDAFAMRRIRNTCRSFMTRDQSWISLLRQIRWWYTKGDHVLPFVAEVGDKIIGYGLLVADGDRAWLTGGLVPHERNRGFGTEIFRFLMGEALKLGLTPYLEVKTSNRVGKRVYKKLGFVEIQKTGDVITMRTRPCHESTT